MLFVLPAEGGKVNSISQTCKHCGFPIEPSNSVVEGMPPYRHTKTMMFACFDKRERVMRNGKGESLVAEPGRVN